MNRPQTRWQIRKSAARAFTLRNRAALALFALREPDPGETRLSESEVLHGVRHGLIAEQTASERASHGAIA